MEVDMVAYMEVDKEADMVADMEVDKVADMVADIGGRQNGRHAWRWT